MHCPRCGVPAAEQQKFCRGCGFSLEKVAHLLEESSLLASNNFVAGETQTQLPPLLNRMSQLWYAGLGLLGGGFVIAICWAVLSEVILKKGNLISGSLFLFFFLGAITLGLSGLYIETQRKKLAQQKKNLSPSDAHLPEILNADTTNRLLPEADPVSAVSITEGTTAKLAEKINSAR